MINICNCKRLGCVVDIEMNIYDGCVEEIIIPGPGEKICGFGNGQRVCDPPLPV